MTTDWLDRAARAADERVSRRQALRLAGVGALSLVPLGALLRAAPAYADPCTPYCIKSVKDRAENSMAFCAGTAAKGYATANPLAIGAAAGCMMAWMYQVYDEQGTCYQLNCGDPDRWPPGQPPKPSPPTAPSPSPAPPPPPPKEPPKKKKKKGIKRKKKPTDLCGPVTCAKGDYCGTCPTSPGGKICCTQPDKGGRSPCCPS